MPAKNVIKIYRENSYYHIYNRGVEKRKIFLDDQDHQVFLSYLKLYLSPRDTSTGLHLAEILNGREKEKILRQAALNNFSDSIDLLAFNLMPNHFHLLIKQYPVNAIKSFMQSILTKYVMYFNRKHHRVGTLFQSTYKGNIVETEEELLILSAYININHHSLPAGLHPAEYSSLPNYLGAVTQPWLKPQEILQYFSDSRPSNTYQSFLYTYPNIDSISHLILEN